MVEATRSNELTHLEFIGEAGPFGGVGIEFEPHNFLVKIARVVDVGPTPEFYAVQNAGS